MERRPRRLWTWIITAAATLVVAGAVVSGLFQFVVLAVPGYREDLSRWVSGLAGRPVRIGALGLSWRGYYPSLDLSRVELRNADDSATVLGAQGLRLGFGLARLVTGEYTPSRIELVGLELRVDADAQGGWRVAALAAAAPGSADNFAELVRPLERFTRIVLRDCGIVVADARLAPQPLRFHLIEAGLGHGLLGYVLDAQIALPPSLGESLNLQARFEGRLAEPAGWAGSFSADLQGASASDVLRGFLAPGVRLSLGDSRLHSSGRISNGQVTEASLRLDAGPVQASRAGRSAYLEQLGLELHGRRAGQSWEVHLERLHLDAGRGAWPAVEGRFRLGDRLEVDLSYLRLEDLAPWLSMLRLPAQWAALHDLSGTVRDLHWVLVPGDELADRAPQFSLRAVLEDLSLPAPGRRLGFAGVSAELAADQNGGRFLLRQQPVTLELPDALGTPVSFESLVAEAQWRRQNEGWLLQVPRFELGLPGASGDGQFDLLLPPDASPVLKLAARFAAPDAALLKPWMPNGWGPGLRHWLTEAILTAGVPQAQLRIEGPLSDFPFQKKPGLFALDIDVADARLAFAPDWPVIEDLDARLEFRGNSLAITARQGQMLGARIEAATANFRDFKERLLEIQAQVSGELPRMYDILRASPLAQRFSGLTEHTQAQGAAHVGLRLEIPLRDASKTQTSGSVELPGVTLRYAGLAEPIRDIRGRLRFDAQGISGEGLTGRIHQIPLAGRMRALGAGASLLSVDLRLAPQTLAGGEPPLLPAFLRDKLSGASRWRAQMHFGGNESGGLTLESELAGTSVNLPVPLGKPAAAAIPLKLGFSTDPDGRLQVALDYAQRLSADLRLRPGESGLALHSGLLVFGGGEARATQSGLVIAGAVPELDPEAWWRALQGSGLEAQAAALKKLDVLAGELRLGGGYLLRDTRLAATPAAQGWQAALSGRGAEGTVQWRGGDAPQLSARLTRLLLERTAVEAQPVNAPPEPVLDPTAWPAVNAEISDLRLGATPLGQVIVQSQRVKHGQRFSQITAAGGIIGLNASGSWRRVDGRSSGDLDFDLSGGGIDSLLRVSGFAPTLDAKISRVRGKLSFPAAAEGLRWAYAEGDVDLAFENGQLRAVEPGAGRVLGLINFYALPRRLSLNFRDVLSTGLGFDSIRGKFKLAGGNATTEDIRLEGPSVRMEMKGRIGLAQRDYDQYVRVYPGVSAGVTLGAALLGGPVAAVFTFLAQEVLKKPLDQVTQINYHLTGPWDSPQVKPLPLGVRPP